MRSEAYPRVEHLKCVVKLSSSSFSLTLSADKLERLSLAIYFHPSLVFAGKARVDISEAPEERFIALLANIRLA